MSTWFITDILQTEFIPIPDMYKDLQICKFRNIFEIVSLIPTRMIYTSRIPFLMDRVSVWMTRMYVFNNDRCFNRR